MQYGVDKATIGLLFLVQSIGYLVAAFSSGLLVEKLGTRGFLMLGVVSFLFGVGALALMLPFMIVLVTMLPLGLGVGIIDAGINAYIASMPRNAARLNYLHAFYGIGALLGPLIASAFLAVRWGWNEPDFVDRLSSGLQETEYCSLRRGGNTQKQRPRGCAQATSSLDRSTFSAHLRGSRGECWNMELQFSDGGAPYASPARRMDGQWLLARAHTRTPGSGTSNVEGR